MKKGLQSIREGNASWGREIDFFAMLEGKSEVEGQLAIETPSTAPMPTIYNDLREEKPTW